MLPISLTLDSGTSGIIALDDGGAGPDRDFDDLVIKFLCVYYFAKLFKREIVDIFFFMNNVGLYELPGLFQ